MKMFSFVIIPATRKRSLFQRERLLHIRTKQRLSEYDNNFLEVIPYFLNILFRNSVLPLSDLIEFARQRSMFYFTNIPDVLTLSKLYDNSCIFLFYRLVDLSPDEEDEMIDMNEIAESFDTTKQDESRYQ